MSYSQQDDDRRPRFGDLTGTAYHPQQHLSNSGTNSTNSPSPNGNGAQHNHNHPGQTLRERAASQPPRTASASAEQVTGGGGGGGGGGYVSSPSTGHFIPSSLGSSSSTSSSNAPWPNSTTRNILTRTPSNSSTGAGGPGIPIRSSSFSSSPSYTSLMRDRAMSRFPSTFEDDELELEGGDSYDERFVPSANQQRGRQWGIEETSRSRSHSLATTGIGMRVAPGNSGYLGGGTGANDGPTPTMSWNESYLSAGLGGERVEGGARWGEIGRPSRQNSHTIDASNMSPFVRDVGQILLDDGSAFRELWAGMPPRDHDASGTTSGTTSRRHSVSVVQPRRGTVVGFDAPDSQPNQWSGGGFGGSGRGLMLSDDDLASDLGGLSLDGPPSSRPRAGEQSQPSSLPIYPRDTIGGGGGGAQGGQAGSPYQSILAGSYSSLRRGGTPSDYDEGPIGGGGAGSYVRARAPSYSGGGVVGSPISPTNMRSPLSPTVHQGTGGGGGQQAPYYLGRRPSLSISSATAGGSITSPLSPHAHPLSAHPHHGFQHQQHQQHGHHAQQDHGLNELGKGLPLSSVPPSWPLYIVEFKAGRTDLFYTTDAHLSNTLRVGDLVIVEADRGKDLGKVINDGISVAEVEAWFKRQSSQPQSQSSGGLSSPTTPYDQGEGQERKKELNPKMIYSKANAQDTQLLAAKTQDEVKALQLCQSKVRAKKLPMEVVDAEYQWDRRKLTFYFVAEKRIDFRELVRELFRLYKTRIWMASLQGGVSFEQ